MGEVLSQNEIDNLLAALSTGELDVDQIQDANDVQVKDYDFWLAEYYDTPSFYYNYKMWQYSKTGSVDGISGDVDMNIRFTKTEP